MWRWNRACLKEKKFLMVRYIEKEKQKKLGWPLLSSLPSTEAPFHAGVVEDFGF